MSVTILQDTASLRLSAPAAAFRTGRQFPFAVALRTGAFLAHRAVPAALHSPSRHDRAVPSPQRTPSTLAPLALSPSDLLA